MSLARVHRCHHARPTCRYCGGDYCPRCDGTGAGHGCDESRDPERDRRIETWWCSGCGHVIERDEARVVAHVDSLSEYFDRYHERCAP